MLSSERMRQRAPAPGLGGIARACGDAQRRARRARRRSPRYRALDGPPPPASNDRYWCRPRRTRRQPHRTREPPASLVQQSADRRMSRCDPDDRPADRRVPDDWGSARGDPSGGHVRPVRCLAPMRSRTRRARAQLCPRPPERLRRPVPPCRCRSADQGRSGCSRPAPTRRESRGAAPSFGHGARRAGSPWTLGQRSRRMWRCSPP